MANIRISVAASPVISASVVYAEPITEASSIEVVVAPDYVSRAVMVASVVLNLLPARIDITVISDVIAKVVRKPVVDGLDLVELITRYIQKVLTDVPVISEVIAKVVGKSLSDGSTLADTASKRVQKSLSDGSIVSEFIDTAVGKVQVDGANISESFSFVLTKSLSDSTVVVENFGNGVFDETFDATFN